jgi:hypothetical protein
VTPSLSATCSYQLSYTRVDPQVPPLVRIKREGQTDLVWPPQHPSCWESYPRCCGIVFTINGVSMHTSMRWDCTWKILR